MAIVGYVAVAVVAVAVLGGLGLTIRSIPDLARYRKLRRM